MENTTLASLCEDAAFVFNNFTNLGSCYDAYHNASSSNYTIVVQTCLKDYCTDTDPEIAGCVGFNNGSTALNFTMHTLRNWGYEYFSSNVCNGVSNTVNTDIAGPGVFISYIMQIIIIVYFWISLRIFHLFPRFLTIIKKRYRKVSQVSRPFKIMAYARNFLSLQNIALKHTLVEFQETQCFFMIASQAAILMARQSNEVFGAVTLYQLWSNDGVAGMVSTAGVFPIVVGMWSLEKMHMLSPWIFFLSVGTVILSEVAMSWTINAPTIRQLVPIENHTWPGSCGNHVPPLIWCGNKILYDAFGPVAIFYTILNPFCLVVFVVVCLVYLCPWAGWVVDRFKVRKKRFGQLFLVRPHRNIKQILESKWGSRIFVRVGPKVFTFLIELLLVASTSVDILCFVLFNFYGLIDFSSWSFGQIVAIMIWFPVVSKYLYWTFFGTESYSEMRVPKPYKIVMVEEEEPRSDTGDIQFSSLGQKTLPIFERDQSGNHD